MRQKHRQIKEKELVNYTLKIPDDVYQNMRKVAFDQNISLAYLMQTAIEEYIDKHLNNIK